jgi:hypothetical protein
MTGVSQSLIPVTQSLIAVRLAVSEISLHLIPVR